jgi:hypothetical protein
MKARVWRIENLSKIASPSKRMSFYFTCPFCLKDIHVLDIRSGHGFCNCGVSFVIGKDDIIVIRMKMIKIPLPELLKA